MAKRKEKPEQLVEVLFMPSPPMLTYNGIDSGQAGRVHVWCKVGGVYEVSASMAQHLTADYPKNFTTEWTPALEEAVAPPAEADEAVTDMAPDDETGI